jgi:murein L,D-transpeptidase YafK
MKCNPLLYGIMMRNKHYHCFFFYFLIFTKVIVAQPSVTKGGDSENSFINFQKSFVRANDALHRKEDTLKKQFAAQNLSWPAKYLYIRSFKYDSQLEVWVKNEIQEQFKLFKTYKVCALAGTLGPKRMEGDYQVPEGFYQINVFNPNSNYHLSLGLNYPNLSDRVLSDIEKPGGDIYIHGSCVTVGCIPIRDEQIEELYVLAAHAKDQGQDFIPVHVFPIRFDVERSVKFLNNLTKDDGKLKKFSERLEEAYDYFETYHQLPIVMIDDNGTYLINEAPPTVAKKAMQNKPAVTPPSAVHRIRKIDTLATDVFQMPLYPEGNIAFANYLEKVGNEITAILPKGKAKFYLQIEFIVDADGVPVNFSIVKGKEHLQQEVITQIILRLEAMATWSPAKINGKPIPLKMMQTLLIGAK